MVDIDAVCRLHNIQYRIINDVHWFLARDVGKAMGLINSRESMRTMDPVVKKKISISTRGGDQTVLFINLEGLKKMISCSRKVHARQLAKSFGITVIDNHYVKIEPAVISFLTRAFQGEEWFTQYRVGPYMIDLFYPNLQLAIEIDEEGGQHRSCHGQVVDRERQTYIENVIQGCRFIRCRPEVEGFCMASLVNEVWLVMKSIKN